MKKVAAWSAQDVSDWLSKKGMPEYIDALCQTDGPALLRLTKEDFEKPPLSLVSSDGGQQILEQMKTLQIENHIEAHKNGHANGHIGGLPNGTNEPQKNGTLGRKDFGVDMVHIHMPKVEVLPSSFPTEWGKTGIAFVYAMVCFVTTTVVISVVHERVPPKEHTPPLPDKFFDLFDRVEWAFSICEINGILLVALWVIQWSLLKHRSIIGRRFFFIVGTLYLYRCITMYITTLPVPGMHFKCSPKLLGDWEAQMRRIMKMIAGGGLSITGSHNMCGDYLYSGHTVVLTLTYLFIKECNLSAAGIFCILLAHDHYTVDVVVAYFITTRLFWWYHTMANQQSLKISHSNPFSRVWWYRLFRYFEENVSGIVPHNYQLPLQWSHGVKYSRLNLQ
uniref:Phosphatidylcholine:ceramide cholinephosphotransferase 1 n=1 Tax=Monopterus albus TaxID=43700 RepID=A0A3Q3QY67_MONAL